MPDLDTILSADDDALLVSIGLGLLGRGSGFGSDDDEEVARRAAERWIADRLEALRMTICSHPLAVQILSQEDGKITTADAIVGIGNAVALTTDLNIGVATSVVVLLTRAGLPRFCGTATG